jgi:hypothetical protein
MSGFEFVIFVASFRHSLFQKKDWPSHKLSCVDEDVQKIATAMEIALLGYRTASPVKTLMQAFPNEKLTGKVLLFYFILNNIL